MSNVLNKIVDKNREERLFPQYEGLTKIIPTGDRLVVSYDIFYDTKGNAYAVSIDHYRGTLAIRG